MKASFAGYYPPSSADHQRLWAESVVVLDANALLDLYRLPTSAQNELLAALELMASRIWIPYQVALEFQRNRLNVIASERKTTEDVVNASENLFENITKQVLALEIDKRALGIEIGPIISELKILNDKLNSAVKKVYESQVDISASDPIRDRLDALLLDKVGIGPKDQAELDRLVDGGNDRYKNKIPPGFMDIDKEKNPNEATFFHDGLKYERKFGDLIMWRQLISYAHDKSIKIFFLVTSEKKEDWWWKERGRTIGPRPELIREMLAESGAELFWIYSSVQFLENAKRYAQAQVSDESLTDLREIASNTNQNTNHFSASLDPLRDPIDVEAVDKSVGQTSFLKYMVAIYNWLKHNYDYVRIMKDFPDLIGEVNSVRHGFEIKHIRSTSRIRTSYLGEALRRGFLEVKEGHIDKFHLILLLEEGGGVDVERAAVSARVASRLTHLLEIFPIEEIILGSVRDNGVFRVISRTRSRDC